MLHKTNNLFENLSATELKKLTDEVKETVDSAHKSVAKPVFTAAQFWDIQKRRRAIQVQRAGAIRVY